MEDPPLESPAAAVPPPPPRPPEPQSPRRRQDWSRPFFWMLLLCLALGLAQFVAPPAAMQRPDKKEQEDFWTTLTGRRGPGITVVKVYGVIQIPEEESFYGDAVLDTQEQLHRILERADIKGVVLRVNSPGGAVGASQEIHNTVAALREKGKKVVVSMADMAASGGYYISAPADYIFVNPGTITGSIGVITQAFVAQELLEKLGLQFQVFKSGAFKDMGAMHRPITDAEKAVFMSIVMGAYDQFVGAVTAGRVLKEETSGRKSILKSEDDVRALADGRIYLGSQAVANGLADAEGDLYDAIAKCGELTGLGKEPTVLKMRSLPHLPEFFQAATGKSLTRPLEELARQFAAASSVPVMYLYQP